MKYFSCKINTTNFKIIFEGKYLIRDGRLGVRLLVRTRDYLFSTPIQTGPGATQTPVQYLLGLFQRVERPRCDTAHPPSLVIKIGTVLLFFICA
jgi:hypothetical protein